MAKGGYAGSTGGGYKGGAGRGGGNLYPLASGRSGGSASPGYMPGMEGLEGMMDGSYVIMNVSMTYIMPAQDYARMMGGGAGKQMYKGGAPGKELYGGKSLDSLIGKGPGADSRLDPKYFGKKSRDSPMYNKMRSGEGAANKSYKSQQTPSLPPIAANYNPLEDIIKKSPNTNYMDSSMNGLGFGANSYNPTTLTSTAGFADPGDSTADQIRNRYRKNWKDYQRERYGIPEMGARSTTPQATSQVKRRQLEQAPLAVM